MDEEDTNPTMSKEEAGTSESTTAEPPKKTHPKVELSPGTRTFLHRMAENLRTHDPDVPKGRNRPH